MTTTTTIIPCRECGEDSGWTEELINQPLFGGRQDVAVCDTCCDAYHEREANEPLAVGYQAPIEDLIPVFYRETELNRLPKAGKDNLANILTWDLNRKKGLYLLGDSRQGKTRSLCLLLQQLHKQRILFKAFFAGDFHTELVDAKRGTQYRQWFKEVTTVPVLAIDDLFAEKLTETTQKGLFEVIEQRMARKLPNLITTQVKSKEAIELFLDKRRGHALLERLRETSEVFIFNNTEKQEVFKV
jgi:DNA replication protein DnaC